MVQGIIDYFVYNQTCSMRTSPAGLPDTKIVVGPSAPPMMPKSMAYFPIRRRLIS